MIPILYPHAEKTFTSNGLGRLVDCISCIVTEERNGQFKCEFEYPINGQHYDDIVEGSIIYVTHDNSGVPQPFDVYRRSVPIDGVVTFEAAHISYRLGNVILKPFTATSCASTLAKFPEVAMNECEFQFATDKNVNSQFTLTYPVQAKAILCGMEGSVLDVYGTGEYKFDKFLVTLYLHRGVDTDVQIRYGKNLVDMMDERDSSNSYNMVVPYWINPETNAVITLPEYAVVASSAPSYYDYWTDENGEYITDENDERFEFDYVALKPVTLDLSQLYETQPTYEQMRAKALQSANDHSSPSRSISIDFVALWQSEEYEEYAPLQQLNLCDTAMVFYNGESVRLKVVTTEYDVLRDRYTRIEMGNPPESYADVVTGEITERLKILPSKSQMQAAITDATQKITGVQGGNVVILQEEGKPQEILIMDTPDMETAVHVLRINMNGIGFSSTGVNGEYTTAWTLDGTFVADFIRAGTLAGDLIRGGKITGDNDTSLWDLATGEFITETSSGLAGIRIFGQTITAYKKSTPTSGRDTTFRLGAYADGQGNFIRNYIEVTNGDFDILGSDRTTVATLESSNIHFKRSAYFDGQALFYEPVYFGNSARAGGALYFGALGDQTKVMRAYSAMSGYTLDHIRITAPHLIIAAGVSSFAQDYSAYGAAFVTNDPVYVYGELTAGTITQRSDERLKELRSYDGAYDDVIDDLEPITFRWKEDDGYEHVGLGARKTKEALDRHGLIDAGLSREISDTYVINYNELTVMLLKRVQDLTKRVEELEGLINAN